MLTGKVKWFNPEKGYGFLIGADGQEVFVHYSSIQGEGFRSLADGEVVNYEVLKAEKGLRASTVARLVPAKLDAEKPVAS